MSYKVLVIPPFDRQVKKLAKKYPSLKGELLELIESLETNPAQGSFTGKNCYKVRLAIASKGKGKSAGARVITNLVITNVLSFYYRFMINQKRQRFQMENCWIFLIRFRNLNFCNS